ncbi:MAG: rRNA pseudouridine synthase [Spirochaetales bacterium]|nr:rRNA pseudouridine synthase [Spirochaetales bacterium]
MKPDAPKRLNHYLALCGVGSRRACETYIREGRVTVEGIPLTDPSFRVTGEVVAFDGKTVSPESTQVYLALHKPPGYLCSSKDPSGKPLAVDLVSPHIPVRLYTVGRLDFLSSGLILLTNDGDFAKKVSHPSSKIEKEYVVETKQPIPEEYLKRCRQGVMIDRIHYRIAAYELKTGRKVRLVLVEGKNREIRKLFAREKLTIKRLHRIRIGPVNLGTLKPGEFRNLKPSEIRRLSGI